MSAPSVVIAHALPHELAVIRQFMLAYAAERNLDLSFQGFQAELDTLPGAYAPPEGALFLARLDGAPAGSVAVRRSGAGIAELKRLYLQSTARGAGVGRRLAVTAIEWAAASGYRTMRLDTVPGMEVAQALYRSLGFVEIEAYRHNPIPGVKFFERNLRPDSA
ncbi:MAG: GNAT family N-acetyltransferase [Gemmatimonadota bacterium]